MDGRSGFGDNGHRGTLRRMRAHWMSAYTAKVDRCDVRHDVSFGPRLGTRASYSRPVHNGTLAKRIHRTNLDVSCSLWAGHMPVNEGGSDVHLLGITDIGCHGNL